MVVQHNLQAMNANRMLGVTTDSQSKATEKLSSGYKINRAADDAAGLTISEKMRKQIRGLDQASTNAQDGVSAVQTAEGALTEVHDMLQRMNELAVQASNGTNSGSDRQAIQDEIDQLTTEIDRVSETTKFNEIYLLKGDAEGHTSVKNIAAHDAGIDGKLTDNGDGTYSFELDNELKAGDKIKIAGKEYTIGESAKVGDYMAVGDDSYGVKAVDDNLLRLGDSKTVKGVTTEIVASATAGHAQLKDAANWSEGDTFIDADGKEWTIGAKTDTAAGTVKADDLVAKRSKYLEGGKITHNEKLGIGTGMTEVARELTIVDKMEATEESILTTSKSTGKDFFKDVAAGDSVSINGKTYTLTESIPESYKKVQEAIKGLDSGDSVTINGTQYTLDAQTDLEKGKVTVEDFLAMIEEGDKVSWEGLSNDSDDSVTVVGVTATADDGDPNDTLITVNGAYQKIVDELAAASSIGTDEGSEAKAKHLGAGKFQITQGTVEVTDALSFNLHVGADADMTNKIMVDVDAMSAAGLGVKGLNVKDETGTAATYAIDAIADAIAKVSAQRSALGAVQNRLEHTIKNLDNVVENTTSAESRIRDTDMAEEMVEYAKNNILAQAGQSMLAQANQSTQGVLSLLG